MWLLNLHLAISVLCFITFWGFRITFYDLIKENGWMSGKSKNKTVKFWAPFIPILNVIFIIVLFIAIFTKKESLDKWVEDRKKEKEARQ